MIKKKNHHHHDNFIRGIFIVSIALVVLQFNRLILFDTQLGFLIYNFFRNPVMASFFNGITNYSLGNIIFGPLIIVLALLYTRQINKLPFFIFSYGSLVLIRYVLQFLIARPRPFMAYQNHPYLGTSIPVGTSFPSFHAASAFFLAYFLATFFTLKPVYTWTLYLLALAVAISRIYLGAHYPLDVIAGSFLGLLWGYGSYHFFRHYTQKNT